MPGVVAPRNYDPGDVIYSEESFAKVIPRKFKDVFCESCGKRSLSLKACTGCSAVKYCNKACQKKDWDSHKLECALFPRLPAESHLVDILRLLAKIILKIKGKDWKDIKKRVMGTDYSFDDIESHYKAMTENRLLKLFSKQMKEMLENYIGKENMPGDVDLVKILGKVKHNLFGAMKSGERNFFIGMCMFETVCIPNSDNSFSQNRMDILAIRRIEKGVDKITIRSKRILSLTTPLNEEIYPPCACADCSLPYGESVLSKIQDEKRAYSVICETETILNMVAHVPEIEFTVLFRMKVDVLLSKQQGVLGKSNILRLRLLALRCLKIGGPPLFFKNWLVELERTMSEVFGERNSELVPVYVALSAASYDLDNLMESARYIQKAKNIVDS